MQVLRAADRTATPWKNGGGVTREVVAWPAGAGLDDFHWRVSMAEVRADGAFSVFPGVDRILAVLRGALTLDINGRGAIDLDANAPPVSFPGDAPTFARVVAGPVTDLNIMSRRSGVRATLDRLTIRPTLALPPGAGARVLIARAPLRAQGMALDTDDALLLGPTDEVMLEAPSGAYAYLADFRG